MAYFTEGGKGSLDRASRIGLSIIPLNFSVCDLSYSSIFFFIAPNTSLNQFLILFILNQCNFHFHQFTILNSLSCLVIASLASSSV
jgi:hypothetical protein